MIKKILLIVEICAIGLCLSACTEEGFRQGGRNLLGGICANSDRCTVHCPEGQDANSYGRCNAAMAGET